MRLAKWFMGLGALCVGLQPATAALINGGFEDLTVDHAKSWDTFGLIPGWALARGPNIELQAGVNGWLAAEGEQYLELDGDEDGPGGTASNDVASSAVFQDVATEPGASYWLTFAFSPRPGVADNQLAVHWEGVLLAHLTASGLGLSNTDWEYHTFLIEASEPTTRIAFADWSRSDGLGTFLDDVSLTRVPEPGMTSIAMLGLVWVSVQRRR